MLGKDWVLFDQLVLNVMVLHFESLLTQHLQVVMRIHLSAYIIDSHVYFEVQGVLVDLLIPANSAVQLALKEVVQQAELAEGVPAAQGDWLDEHLEAKAALQLLV